MCGIWCCLGPTHPPTDNVRRWIKTLVPRGPEETRIFDVSGVGILGFTRLAINGLNDSGMQPMKMSNDSLIWMCNGEIYNWRSLAKEYGLPNHSGSDCEILGPLYERFCELGIPLTGLFRALDGVFAIIIVDRKRGRIIVARDPYGVRPLFMGQRHTIQLTPISNSSSSSWVMQPYNAVFGSELKSMVPFCDIVSTFPPGTYSQYDIASRRCVETHRYHTVQYLLNPLYGPPMFGGGMLGPEFAMMAIREALITAVQKRMMTERPVAALLSGGVDSSLIAALVARELKQAGAPPLKTFSIGMAGSTDLFYAKKVAEHIGSEHTEVILTADDFFKAIPKVIYSIESFDTTTVRASVGNWLVAKAIREQSDCKVVFNGDGSDEVWGSYLYFYNAPSDAAFEEEVSRLLEDIHRYDVLRSDRCISSHGLEPRTPFLDKQFVATARSICTSWRRPVRGVRPEKWLMRKAFESMDLLPREVLWRQKEAFSDGVSGQERSWYEIAQEKAADIVGDNWQELADRSYGNDVATAPKTAEQYYYRYTFDVHFGRAYSSVNVPQFWMPRWCENATDPSARTLKVYAETGSGGGPAP